MFRYDDVGSLPLPDGVDSDEFDQAFIDLEDWALDIYRKSMKLKIEAGVEVPCYPQLRDMNDQFLKIFNDSEAMEEPYLVRESATDLPEFVALEEMEMDLPSLKVCITGPLELSVAEFEGRIYEDVMLNMARSLKRFVERVRSSESLDVDVVSVDEPSLGTNPELDFDSENLIEAWNIVGDVEEDVQIHLHSSLHYEVACKSEGIDIIDIGTASSPEYLEDVNPEIIDSYGKALRTGISRTDILSMSAEYNDKHDVNIWTDEAAWDDFLANVENPSEIMERLEEVYQKYGDLIEYVGPDCGLGGAKREELAERILKNTREGINLFLNKN